MVNVLVVEEDVDIRDPLALEWVVAFRVNAAEGQLLSCGPTFGSVLDPSTPREQANRPKCGTGKWTRVRIDATRSWEFERKIQARWSEYGIGLPYLSEERREQLTFEKLRRVLPPAMRRAAENA